MACSKPAQPRKAIRGIEPGKEKTHRDQIKEEHRKMTEEKHEKKETCNR